MKGFSAGLAAMATLVALFWTVALIAAWMGGWSFLGWEDQTAWTKVACLVALFSFQEVAVAEVNRYFDAQETDG